VLSDGGSSPPASTNSERARRGLRDDGTPMSVRRNAAARGPEVDPVLAAYLADVDIASIRKNLALSHEERFLQLMDLQKFAEELRRAGRKAASRD
jgi:hypothetical protein